MSQSDEHGWIGKLNRLGEIRKEADYQPTNVDFIRDLLVDPDDRVRAAANLTAAGCVFEPHILDTIIENAQGDLSTGVRKAAIQSLKPIIQTGIEQQFENNLGATTHFDDAEEWDEIQTEDLIEDYLRVKETLIDLMEFDEDPEIQASALLSLADLAELENVQDKIHAFANHADSEIRLSAIKAMGHAPDIWSNDLIPLISMDTEESQLVSALQAAAFATTRDVAQKVETVLSHPSPEVLVNAITALAYINQSADLMSILQNFSLHDNGSVQEAARDAIELVSKTNFREYMTRNLGMGDNDA